MNHTFSEPELLSQFIAIILFLLNMTLGSSSLFNDFLQEKCSFFVKSVVLKLNPLFRPQPSRSPPNALASPLRPDQRSHRSASVSNPLVTSPRSAPPNFPRDAWSPPRPPSSLAPRSPTKEWSKFFYTGPNIPQP